MQDTQAYKEKKAFFESLITVYGRNVLLEMLQDESIDFHKVHMAESNRQDGTIKQILALAKKRGIEVRMHTRAQLSRISKNSRQDQGVAADIAAANYLDADRIPAQLPESFRLLALDGIQNPQNLGMIIRSAAAGSIDGIVLPKRNSAKLSPLVIKASAGTLFKINIYHGETLVPTLKRLRESGAEIYALSSHAKEDIYTLNTGRMSVFVLGNESEGVSDEVQAVCTGSVSIPMNKGVESLNVAVTAALIAFMKG